MTLPTFTLWQLLDARTPRFWAAVVAWVVIALVTLLSGCGHGPVYEYRIIEEVENGFRAYSGPELPPVEDGRMVLYGDDGTVKVVSVEDVEIRQVQIGPHQCECGTILRTYRERCPKCERMILLGSRTPPDAEVDE